MLPKRKNVNNDVSKYSPINRYAKTNIAQVQAWGLSAIIKIWGWSVRSPQAGYSEEAILSNRLCWIESVWQTIVMKLYNLVNGTGYLSELKKKKNLYVRNSKASCKFHYSYAGSRGHLSRKIKGLLLSPCSFLPLPEKGCFSFVSCF